MKNIITSLLLGVSVVASTLTVTPALSASLVRNESCSTVQSSLLDRIKLVNDRGDRINDGLDNIYLLGTKDRLMLVQELGSYQRDRNNLLSYISNPTIANSISNCADRGFLTEMKTEQNRLKINDGAILVWSANNWR